MGIGDHPIWQRHVYFLCGYFDIDSKHARQANNQVNTAHYKMFRWDIMAKYISKYIPIFLR
ncbi:hypothetical protein G9425_24370 [Escherichia coli]|nr:hypothetical protein [Escherichia coli]MDN6921942.1 hypothetical protein [Klebsiella pneumoniae]OVW89001.1 hypothetical protein BME43_09335 [Klebsiella pneumoniae]OVW98160.1 hypothetical protein BME33_09540 [Klebsiella pneumoniae]RDY45903.1 hypothetical protein DX996_21510 [Klebsiella pneumoniae]